MFRFKLELVRFGAQPNNTAMAPLSDSSRSSSPTPPRRHLVCFSDGSTASMSAASVIYEPDPGVRAGKRNKLDEMRCVLRNVVPNTAGAMELAGIALSLTMCANYASAFQLSGSSRHDAGMSITCFCDNKPIVECLLLEGLAVHRGARHLNGLVTFVRAHVNALRLDGHEVFIRWCDRRRLGLRRSDHVARCGIGSVESPWPNGLTELLWDSNQTFFEATEPQRDVMRRY